MWKNKNVLSNCPSLYMFSLLHISSVGLHRHWVTWIAAFNKVSQQEQKLESVLFRGLPALFRRFLSSELSVFPCFSWFTFVLFMTTNLVAFTSVAFLRKMLQMPKCNKQFQWDSILWAMTVSLTDFSHAAATPPVLSDLHYWDLELDLAKALRSQVLKSKKCPLSYTHPRTI